MLTKNPADVASYGIDWSADLGTGETIATSAWSLVTSAGVTLGADTHDGASSSVKVSGGTNGLTAQLRNSITTTAANTFVKTIAIAISDPAALPLGSLPISLAEVKVRLDIETSDLDPEGVANVDAQVLGALRGAVDYVEAQTQRVLRRRVMSKSFDHWPCFPLTIEGVPMRDVLSISYVDEDGATQTFAEAGWTWVPTPDGARIVLIDNPDIPRTRYGWPNAVTVNFEAGYDPSGTVPVEEVYALPPRVEQAVVMMTGHLFNNRDAVGTERAYEVPLGVENLLINARQYR